jgi:hypothetical protein
MIAPPAFQAARVDIQYPLTTHPYHYEKVPII